MTNESQSKRPKNQSHQTLKKQLFGGALIATLLAVTPYFFYLHESVPDTQVWNTFFFTYDSTYFGDANYVMWIFTGKAIPLLFLFLWFFTCRHWWYHALLVPIAMYLYQIFGLFNDDYKYFDEFELVYLLPIMAIVIPSIYVVRAKLFNKMNENKSLQELEDEFTTRPGNIFDKIKDYF